MRLRVNRFFLAFSIFVFASHSQAGFLKFLKKEALPTITGQRSIVIKPYVSVKSGTTAIKLGQDSAMIKVGGVTVQTGKLRLRLAQAGCLYATGGDVMTCAPDIIEREAGNLFADIRAGGDGSTKASGGAAVKPGGGTATKPADTGMSEIPWGAPDKSVGFDFSNPGSPATAPSPSAFFHTIAVARTNLPDGKAAVEIFGRADYGFMLGKQAGVLCIFATDKGKYLKASKNSEYSDQYGIVAVGGTTKIQEKIESMSVQLRIPWVELNVPDDVDPYAPKFVQCSTTVDNKVMQSLEWIPF
jgi:hypothetical protein